jgi:hypothetical protein
MSKKFTGGLSSLLEKQPATEKAQPTAKRGRPARTEPREEKVASFVVSLEHLQKIKAVAYWERLTAKEVLATALEEYFTRYEKKNGPIKEVSK